jgi:hypothetical protein
VFEGEIGRWKICSPVVCSEREKTTGQILDRVYPESERRLASVISGAITSGPACTFWQRMVWDVNRIGLVEPRSLCRLGPSLPELLSY